uniref:Mitochondrial-processing peptidase subunit beta n=1 Tax=Panagrellus redivivus TaxID=6233 RepID=A0A7E4URP6_PANRE
MRAFRRLGGVVRPTLQTPVNRRSIDRTLASLRQEKRIEYPETQISTLPSGFRVATEASDLATATVGVWIDAGSRYENAKNNGVAHYLEHMAFKGTKKRSQWELELEVENIGAHLNAYTSREQTVYYAKCFAGDVEPAVEMLSDLLLHSVYGKDEIERERGVILREMEEVEQNMQEVVFDLHHMGAYKGCSLARTILGPEENIKKMTRDDLVAYVKQYYKGPRMLLAGAGGVEHGEMIRLAQKYFGVVDHGADDILDYEPGKFVESHERFEQPDMDLVYGCISVEGTNWTHPDSITMQIANTMLGQFDRTMGTGLSASSRLAQTISHNDGVQSFLSFTTNYKDTGLAGVYFVSEPTGLRTIAEAVCTEWRNLCDNVNEADLERAKRYLYTNMVSMLDGSTPICEDIGRQIVCYGRRLSIGEIEARINAVNVNTIRELFRNYFVNKPVSSTVIGVTKDWPKQEEIKAMLTY